ncbi:hypothetical protein HAX54_015559, partial [Datura stramonium]|nr:hypothetical protein [Datura stramonium]
GSLRDPLCVHELVTCWFSRDIQVEGQVMVPLHDSSRKSLSGKGGKSRSHDEWDNKAILLGPLKRVLPPPEGTP